MVRLNHSTSQRYAAFFWVAFGTYSLATPLALFNHFDKTKHYHLSLEYNNANDVLALKDATRYSWQSEGYSPREGSNIAIIDHRVDLGMNLNSWYIGYALRYDMFVKTDRSTMDIMQLINTQSDLPFGRQYDIYLKTFGVASHNLILSKSFMLLPNLKAFAGVSLIQAFATQDGFVDAYANVLSKNEYDFEGYSEYYYDKNLLYTLDVDKPTGYGYSLMLGLEYHYRAHTLRFLAQDIASTIYWQALPYSEVLMTSDTKEYDSNGYVKYKPSISGYELYRDYPQKLESKYLLEYEYQQNQKLSGKVALGYYHNTLLPFVALKYNQNQNINYSIGYEARFHQLSLGMEFYDFKASIATNDITHPTAVSMNLSYAF